MSRTLTSHLSLVLLALSVCALMACGDTDESPVTLDECVTPWAEDYAQRFVAGETFFLPGWTDASGCDGLAWSLSEAPDGSGATVVDGEDGSRFTPLVSGDYRFEVLQAGEATATTLTLEVLDALERPFHNYNYFPSHRSGVWVDGELWIAGVYTPEVARFAADEMTALAPILVGQWPTALSYAASEGIVLVANKASDTVGFIDVSTRQQTDAIWVGDEPTNIVWDAARGQAYVALSGANQVAVLDVKARRLVATIDAVFDPLALAMTPDGDTLLVASHRSGQSAFYPHNTRNVETEEDVAIIDLEALKVTGYILEVSSTIQAMDFDDEGQLWVSATSNNTEGGLNDPEAMSFIHELFTLTPSAGEAERGRSVDLSRQATSGGSTATIHGFGLCEGGLWVVAEGANQAVELDPSDLTERRRVAVTGRPRAMSCGAGAVWIISSNRGEVTRIAGDEVESAALGLTERRDALLVDGLERFTGQGLGAGDNRSCNNCHADGLSDGQIWNAGPVESRLLSRPLRWLEGTSMIGWDGYVGSVKISGYVGGPTINDRGTTESALAMGAYLASLMPSPPANSFTRRDGSLSEEGLVGKALFEGKAACSGCHAGPVLTNQQVMPDGLTEGKTDIPTLVDVSRIGSWYKTGVMPSLHDTVVDTATKFGVDLTEAELAAVTRYLQELTGRDFFVLHADMGPSSDAFPVDSALELTFSYPVLDAAENLDLIALRDEQGERVPCDVVASGRHVTVTPAADLEASSVYTLTVDAGCQADDARVMVAPAAFELQTAAPAALILEGDYALTVWVPMLDFAAGGFDMDDIVEQTSRFVASPTVSGAAVQIDYGADMRYDDVFVLDGATFMSRDLPIALGPSFLNGSPIVAEALDEDGDGVVDLVEGTFTLSGPGIELSEIAYRIALIPPGTCIPGPEGDTAPVITQEGDDVIIDWGDGGALALYVTSPDATLPFGPGNIEGGTTYWAVTATNFPDTFSGPITYGVIPEGAEDSSVINGGPLGGAPLESGVCYRFSVVVDLKFSHTMVVWP